MSAMDDSSKKAVANSPNPTRTAAKIDLLISLYLHSWPALTLAIQNRWGGPASDDKRDWFAGAISELLMNGEVADADDLEEVLIQVMLDEFEVVVDDDSPAEIAGSIMKGRQRILQQDYSEVDRMLARWEEKQKNGQQRLLFKRVEQEDDGQDTDWESSDSEDEDVDMDEAPQLVPVIKQVKPAPVVDEDGFTKVAGKQRR
jgi:pre-rRNA-processing protein TSR2